MAPLEMTLLWIKALFLTSIFQITDTKEQMLEYQSRPQRLVASYIKKQMNVALSMVKSLNIHKRGSSLRFQTYEDDTPRQDWKKETTEAKNHQHAPSWPSFEFETNKKDSTPPDF